MHQFAPPNSMADRTEAMNPALSVQVPVKRKRRREKKSLPMDASELKQIDPNWLDLLGVVTEGKIEETDERIVVQAHVEFDVMPPCTKCHSNGHVTKWDFRDSRNIKDAERNIKRVLIVLVVQRFFCASCDKAFTPLLSFLERGRLSRTERLNDYAKARGFERRTSSDVAALSGLNRRTVQNIQREAAQSMPTPQQVFSSVTGKGHILQIDNAHPSLGECTSMLLDAKPFELLGEYNEAAITAFFATLEGRENVTCYVSDTAEFLLRLGRKYYPNATVVADPYHVVRRLLLRFDTFLKRFEDDMLCEYIRAIDDQRIVRPVRALKMKRKKDSDLEQNVPEMGNKDDEENIRRRTAAEIRILLHSKIGETNQTHKKAVKFLLRRFPDVRAAYYYLQRVMRLYHTTEVVSYARDASGLRTATVKQINAADASRALDKSEARLPQHVIAGLSIFLDSCRKNRDVICAFWQTGWTCADIESQNGVIKEIDRMAHGLELAELRRRWLYGQSISAILGRDFEKVIIKKDGLLKKDIRELSRMPPPEPVPRLGAYGQYSLF